MMTPTAPNLEPPRVIVATVDGNSSKAKPRESRLKDIIWPGMQVYQFTNTKDSAWSIIDTILCVDPIKLQYLQDELGRICTTLPTQSAPRSNWSFFSSLFKFRSLKFGLRVSAFNVADFCPR